MKHKKVTLKTVDGFRLSAIHTVTEASPIVVWLHGITVDKDEYLGFFKDGSEFMGHAGISSLRFDFRGHGKSSGKPKDFSIIGQLIDVDSAISYLRTLYKEKLQIHMVGCSFGAVPCLYASKEYSGIVKSVTLIAPVLSYRRTFLQPSTDWASAIFNKSSIEKLFRTNKLPFSRKFACSMKLYKEMQSIQAKQFISEKALPVTIFHGDSDTMVPFYVSKEFSQEYNHIKFFQMKGMDHGFNDKDDEDGTKTKSIENRKTMFQFILKSVSSEIEKV